MSELIKSIKCPNCNGNINLDFDNLISYCPFCASPLTIDTALVKDILIEREKTKQVLGKAEIKFQEKKLEAKKETRNSIFWVLFVVISFILILIGCVMPYL